MSKKIRQTTIGDVADATGVSKATVSRALAGYGRISEETEKRIKRVADELGYRPNEVARAMRAGKTGSIGLVVISDYTNAFFAPVTKAIIDSARALGLETLVAHIDEDYRNENMALQTMVNKRVDGLIVVPSANRPIESINTQVVGKTPLILIDRKLEGSEHPAVVTNDRQGAIDAVTYAHERGHRKMGFLISVPGLTEASEVQPEIPISTVRERTEGFLTSKELSGVSSRFVFLHENVLDSEVAIQKLLESDDRPTILFTSNNDVLTVLLKVMGKLKLKVARDVSVISFDDSPWTESVDPPLTVISRSVEQIGTQAVEALDQLIKGSEVEPVSVIATKLIIRDSVRQLTE